MMPPPPSREQKVCSFWMDGRCNKGMACTFRHPVLPNGDQGPPMFDNFNRDRPPNLQGGGGKTLVHKALPLCHPWFIMMRSLALRVLRAI